MLQEINLSETKNASRLKYLIYGDPGVGKSILAAKAARWGRTLIFDLDGRIASVKEYIEKNSPQLLLNIDVISVQIDGRESEAAREVAQKLLTLRDLQSKGECPYSTIIFDSWTNWESVIMQKIISETPEIKRKQIDLGNVVFAAPDRNTDYNLHASGQRMFVKQLMGLTYPMNVIVVAHTREVRDANGNLIGSKISAAGRLAADLAIDFDEVHLMFWDKGVRRLRVVGDGRSLIKSAIQPQPEKGIVSDDLSIFDERAYKQPTKEK